MSRGIRLSGELAIFPPLPSTGPEAPDDLESVQYKTRGTRYKRSCRSSRAQGLVCSTRPRLDPGRAPMAGLIELTV